MKQNNGRLVKYDGDNIKKLLVKVSKIESNDIKPMKELIALKESKENFEVLLERFDAFSGIESMHNYTTIYAPFIQSFIT